MIGSQNDVASVTGKAKVASNRPDSMRDVFEHDLTPSLRELKSGRRIINNSQQSAAPDAEASPPGRVNQRRVNNGRTACSKRKPYDILSNVSH